MPILFLINSINCQVWSTWQWRLADVMLGAGMALAREQWGGSRGCAATSCVVLRELFLMADWTSCLHILAVKSFLIWERASGSWGMK